MVRGINYKEIMENNSLLSKLNDLEARFQEVSTLITDPAVVADMKRYVRLNKEYRELEQILDARKRYINLLTTLSEAKDLLANESDPELREMAREEIDNCEKEIPVTEEEIKRHSIEENITADTPPAFIWHTAEDTSVSPLGSLRLAEAYALAGVGVEMHLYPYGPHATATGAYISSGANPAFIDSKIAEWIPESVAWMKTV